MSGRDQFEGRPFGSATGRRSGPKLLSFRKRLLTTLFAIGLVPLTVTDVVSFVSAKTALESKIGNGFSAQATEIIDKVDRLIFERKRNVVVWSWIGSMQDIQSDDSDGFIAGDLRNFKAKSGFFRDLAAVGKEGEVVSSTLEQELGASVSEESWFREAMKGNVVVEGRGRMSAPVRAEYNSETIIGVLTGQLDWSGIEAMIDNTLISDKKQSEESYVVLVDREGKVIVAPEFMRMDARNLTVDVSGLKLFQKLKEGQSGHLIEEVNNREMLAGYAVSKGYRDFAGLGWSIIIMQDLDEALSLVDGLRMNMILILALGVVLISISGVMVTNSMTRPIRRIVDGLSGTATHTSDAASQVSASAQELSARNAEQESSLQAMSECLDRFTSITEGTAENAERASLISGEVMSSVRMGGEAMEELQAAMAGINESSEKVGRIIRTIEDISQQTNLLALNAAVEAARAGNQGRGFAVVAEEVRNLAQRAGSGVRDSARLVEESGRNARAGSDVSERVGSLLKKITDGYREVSGVIAQISEASKKQSEGIVQIDSSMSAMDRVTRLNVTSSEESAAASEKLSGEARTLNGMISELGSMIE